MGTKSLLLGVVLALGVGLAAWLVWQGTDTAPPDVRSGAPRVGAPGAFAATAPTTDPDEGESAVTQPPPIERESGAEAGPAARCTFLGTVEQADGRALPNAKVELFVGAGLGETLTAIVTTDALGHFRFEVPTAEGRWSLRATLEGFGPGTLGSVRSDVPVRLRLEPTLRVTGRVTARGNGSWIAGAKVESGATLVAGDEQGRYEIEVETRSGLARLSASAPGFVEQSVQLRLHEQRHTELDFALAANAPLTVQVVDGSSGAPIAGATVRSEANRELGTTDDGGRVVVEGGEGRVLNLSFAADGYCPVAWYWTMEEEPMPFVRIPLWREARVAGRVTSVDGQPVIAVVRVLDVEARSRSTPAPRGLPGEELPGELQWARMTWETSSDADGRYSLPVRPQATPQYVQAKLPGWASERSRDLVMAPGTTAALDLVLTQAFGSVRGVVRRNGVVVPVQVTCRVGEFERSATAGRGGYLLDEVPVGLAEISVFEPNGRRLVANAQVTVVAGETAKQDFAYEAAEGVIAGRVTRGQGGVAAGLSVSAHETADRDARSYQATTGADGTYRLTVAADAVYSVIVQENEDSASRQGVRPDAHGVDLSLPEVGLLRVRLSDRATGQPIRQLGLGDVSWRVNPGGGPYRFVRSQIDDTGLLLLRLPVGLTDLCIDQQRAGYVRCERFGIPVTADDLGAEVRIELERGVDVRVTVTGAEPFSPEVRSGHLLFLLEDAQADLVAAASAGPGGEANLRINGVSVRIASFGLQNQMPRFDDAGHATVPGLAPGRYRLRAIPDDLVFEPATFVVGSEGADVELRWRRR